MTDNDVQHERVVRSGTTVHRQGTVAGLLATKLAALSVFPRSLQTSHPCTRMLFVTQCIDRILARRAQGWIKRANCSANQTYAKCNCYPARLDLNYQTSHSHNGKTRYQG